MIKLIDENKFSKGFEELGIKLFTLKNKNGIVSQITNYGGRIVNLFVPDKNDVFEDVVLGYDSAKDYLEKPDHFFGAIIGRYGNRIADGKISIENNEFLLAKNEAESQLHGGAKGFHAVVWKAEQISESVLELTHFSKHLDQGFPGNLEVKVVYTLTDESELQIEYFAVSDAKTVINLTNHSYFNLSGDFNKSIENHLFQIKADYYLPVNDKMIPIGNLENVTNSPFDFKNLKTIKQALNEQHKQIELGSGFDHNFVLDDVNSDFVAKVIDENSSRVLEVYTTEPGVQFYSGNHLNNIEGKNDILYQKRAAFCLETQHFPNSPNQSSFPSTLLLPEEKYFSRTIYKFSVYR
jgi:aldose 1-epimerase